MNELSTNNDFKFTKAKFQLLKFQLVIHDFTETYN